MCIGSVLEHWRSKKNKPLYHIERKISELDNKNFDDGTHIIYVNGKYRENDAIEEIEKNALYCVLGYK